MSGRNVLACVPIMTGLDVESNTFVNPYTYVGVHILKHLLFPLVVHTESYYIAM